MFLKMLINGSWVNKKANLLAMQQDVQDETLDTAKVEIMADAKKEPYEPRTKVYIQQDGETDLKASETLYTISTDMVSVFSLSPLTYKHTMTLVQSTRELSHYILPNMVITQPRESTAKTTFITKNYLNLSYYGHKAAGAPEYYTYASWTGFTSDNMLYTEGGGYAYYYLRNIPSRYWGECLPRSENASIAKAELRFKLIGYKGTLDSSHKVATSSVEELTTIPSHPSWLTPRVVIYHCSNNVNRVILDSDITDRENLYSFPLTSDYFEYADGYFKLTGFDITNSINAYTDGYIMAEIVTEVTGTVPAVIINYPKIYDRLFVDKSEFTNNNLQACSIKLELKATYKQNTLYGVLEKIIKRQQAEYGYGNKTPLFYLPSETTTYGQVLVNTIAPEFTFTGLTVFQAVSQVLETIDALPVFSYDKSTDRLYLYFEYTNGKSVTGTQSKATIAKQSGFSTNNAEEKYVNGVLTNFTKAERIRTFPAQGGSSYAPCGLKNYGVPELADYALVVDKPIKYINSVVLEAMVKYIVCYDDGTKHGLAYAFVKTEVDITDFIYDEATYSSALIEDGSYPSDNHNIRMQMNCLKFRKGTRYIDIGNKATTEWNIQYRTFDNMVDIVCDKAMGIWAQNVQVPSAGEVPDQAYGVEIQTIYANTWIGNSKGDFSTIRFRCEYASDLDGRLQIESIKPKKDGQMNVSASGASIDIGKLGLNMLGVSMRTGVPTMTCTQMIGSWDERIKKGALCVYDGENWIATKCNYQTLGDKEILGTIEFTKDFNGLSKRIALNQSKRFSNISDNLIQKSEVNIVNYVYAYPELTRSLSVPSDNMPINISNIVKLIAKAFGNKCTNDTAEAGFARYYLDPVSSGVRDVYMPLVTYGSGNCLCFETSFNDPISAGIRMDVSRANNGKWWWDYASAVGTKRYFGKDVKYATDEGYAESVSIDYVVDTGNIPTTYPYIPSSGSTKIGTLNDLKFYKMPNEILAVNYELAFLPYNETRDRGVYFGKRFFDLIGDTPRQNFNARFKYQTDPDYRYDPTCRKDTKGTMISTSRIYFYYHYDGAKRVIDYYNLISTANVGVASEKQCYGFSITDEDDNIILCANLNFVLKNGSNGMAALPSVMMFSKINRL